MPIAKLSLFTFSFLFLTCLPLQVDAATISKSVTNLGIVGWWPLNEGVSTLAHDISVYENNGTLTNMDSATDWVAGKRGRALDFDGSNDYIQIPYSSSLAPTQYISFGTWFNSRDTTGSQRVISKTETGGYQISLNENGVCSNSTLCAVAYIGGAYRALNYSLSNISTNTWYHVFATYDGATFKMYLNGQQINSLSISGSIQYSTSNTLCIGSEPGAVCNAGGYFKGKIDDVRIYNRALSATEVLGIYKSGETTKKTVSQNGLLAWWKFDDGTSTKATDFSGNGNTGTFTGSPSWVTGKFGSAISTNNTSGDYINAPNVDIGADWTATAWFKYPLSSIGPTWNTLFRGDTPSGDHQVIVQKSTNLLGMYDNNGTNFRSTGFNMTTLSSGWHHITVVGTGTVQNFYIDGVYVGQTDKKSTTNIRSIGNYWGSNQNWGTFDDVRIYDRALSMSEISSLYKETAVNINHSQNTKFTDGLVGLWSFNGADVNWTSSSAGVAYDRSGNSNTGTITNMNQSTSPAAGRVGQALNFVGSSVQYVNVPHNTNLNPTDSVTVSVWAKIQTLNAYQNIISKGSCNSGFSNDAYVMCVHVGGNLVIFYGSYANGSTYVAAYASISASELNTWVHLTGVIDSTAQKIYMYKNGVLTGSANYTGGIQSVTNPVRIGGDGGVFNLTGSIDEARIYNRALSATEIKQLYLMGK